MNHSIRFTLVLLFISMSSCGQTATDSTLFDFWVGTWDAVWKNPDGTTGKGINHITKILEGKVIQENFVDPTPGSLKGTSISVYHTATKTWRQAWADNQGGYYNLEGGVENGKRFFRTQLREQDGKKMFQRMVFYDIKSGSFTWDWESTTDGGKTWTLQWRINYTKVKAG